MSMHRSLARLITVAVLVVAAVAASPDLVQRHAPSSANAEEQAIVVMLSYEPGYSNFGPTDIYGAADIWPNEGEATIAVHVLPQLFNGAEYVWWVVNRVNGHAMRLGAFDTDSAGDYYQDTYLHAPLPTGADSVVVTVWQPGQSNKQPGKVHSLAGWFPHAAPPPSQLTRTAASSAAAVPGTPTAMPRGTVLRRYPTQGPTYVATTAAKTPISANPITGRYASATSTPSRGANFNPLTLAGAAPAWLGRIS
jgi:hypothetical protein